MVEIEKLSAEDLADHIQDSIRAAVADLDPPIVVVPDAESVVDKVRKWGTFAVAMTVFVVGLYAYLTGKTDAPPAPPPPIPAFQSIPPGHTAMIQHDANGRITMSVAPAAK